MKQLFRSADITVAVRVKKALLSQAQVRALILRAAEYAELERPFAVNVQIVGLAASRTLNRQWRGKDKPTNVLSFAAREGGMPTVHDDVEDLGDIVICPAIIQKEAPNFDVAPRTHAARLVVHGFLHLLGHDHEQDKEAVAMEALEWRIVNSI